jgi:magnesium-transporting ATPase (P-type)
MLVVRPPWVPDFQKVVGGLAGLDDETFTELEVLKVYEFSSELRRMSVVSRRHHFSSTVDLDLSTTPLKDEFDTLDVFCKGAPESIKLISHPDSCTLK